MKKLSLLVLAASTLTTAGCGDTSEPNLIGPDAGIDAGMTNNTCTGVNIAGRDMGVPTKWSCGGSSGEGPDGAINTPTTTTCSLEPGTITLPTGEVVCATRCMGQELPVETVFQWVPQNSLKVFETPTRFYVQPPRRSDWIRCDLVSL